MLSSSWRTSKEDDCPCTRSGFLSREATMQKGIRKNREGGGEVWTKQTLLQHISCCLGGRCWRNSCPPHLAVALPPTAGKIQIRLRLPLKWPSPRGSPKRLRFLTSVRQTQPDEHFFDLLWFCCAHTHLHMAPEWSWLFAGLHEWWGRNAELLHVLRGVSG